MKKIKRSLLFLGVVLIMSSCTKDELYNEEKLEVTTTKSKIITTKKSDLPFPEIVENTIIVHYNNPDILQEEKDEFKDMLMGKYNFRIEDDAITLCNCNTLDIEKWTLDASNEISIEELLAALENEHEDSGVSADRQFVFNVPDQDPHSEYTPDLGYKARLWAGNSSKETPVNIAVLDTGINLSYFEGNFLYDSSNSDNCRDEISGWDFVNDDPYPFDDHNHGSIVTKIMTNNLDYNDIPYKVLPIKIFNEEGKGTYWDLLCALNYITSFDENFIVNASFGFYGLEYPIIMEEILEANSDKLLIVNSSGNEKKDTDLAGNEHYPSGYKLNNMIVVGGYEEISNSLDENISQSSLNSNLTSITYIDIADFNSRNKDNYTVALDSNFGSTSVDVVTQFHHEFYLSNRVKANASGTSFAAPIVSARAALLLYNNQTITSPKNLINITLNTSFISEGLNSKIRGNSVMLPNILYDPGYSEQGSQEIRY